tara:strand:+ start:55 stop:351 length:297 start_codon:yes stop_codon:yes gene_type:complete
MNEGMENLKEIEALKQQLHTDREKAEVEHLRLTKKYAELLAINEDQQKEIALVREDAQIEILRLEKRNSEHQKLNGELQEKLSKYEDKAAHYRRKAIL